MSSKRRPAGNGNLTNYQRKVICEFYRKSGGVMSQKDLAQWTKHEFGLQKTPAQSTISGILRRQHEFVHMSSQELGIKKRRVVQHPALDAALANWVIQCANRGIAVQGDLTKEKAKEFAKQLAIPENEQPEFSNGWLHSFQLRHNFSFRKFNADSNHERRSAVTKNVLYFSSMEELLTETDKYEPRNVFAMDETAVLYTLPPTQNAVVENPLRAKKRFVLSLATNADGSEKLQPLFVSHHEHPKCFRKKTAEQHGLHYFANNKAWMTGVIFSRWLQRLDFAMANQKRRILLFVNDAPSHVVSHLELKNVTVFVLTGGTAQMLNPVTTRLVTSFKKQFRRCYLQHALDKAALSRDGMFDVDVLQAMKWAASSWEKFSDETIKRAWLASNLLRPRLEMQGHELLQDPSEASADAELEQLLFRLRSPDPVPLMEYLNDEGMADATIHEEFFDEIDNVCDVPEDEIDETADDTPSHNLSLQEKLKAFRDVLHVLKDRDDTDDSSLNMLRRVQDALRMEGQKELESGDSSGHDVKSAIDLGSAAVSLGDGGHMDALLESSESSALSAASASLAESTGGGMLSSAADAEGRQSADDFHAMI